MPLRITLCARFPDPVPAPPGTRAGLPVYIPHLADQKILQATGRPLAESHLRFQVISKTLCPVRASGTRVPVSHRKFPVKVAWEAHAAQYGAGNVPVHVTPIGARSIEHRLVKILSGLAREAQSLPRIACAESLALIAQ
jgi:hypothetical protein